MRIGFQQNSYTVSERDESVRVCVEMTTGNYTVPVTLAVLNTGSAQSMYPAVSCVSTNKIAVLSARLLYMCMCKAGLSNYCINQLEFVTELNFSHSYIP